MIQLVIKMRLSFRMAQEASLPMSANRSTMETLIQSRDNWVRSFYYFPIGPNAEQKPMVLARLRFEILVLRAKESIVTLWNLVLLK